MKLGFNILNNSHFPFERRRTVTSAGRDVSFANFATAGHTPTPLSRGESHRTFAHILSKLEDKFYSPLERWRAGTSIGRGVSFANFASAEYTPAPLSRGESHKTFAHILSKLEDKFYSPLERGRAGTSIGRGVSFANFASAEHTPAPLSRGESHKTFAQYLLIAILSILLVTPALAQVNQNRTYCNPINLDYTYMIYNAEQGLSYRSGADPAVVKFRGEYYMFVTRSLGYWHSKDLTNWDFITPEKWYFQGSNAPAAHNYKDSVLYVTGDPSGSMSVLYTDNPKKGDWKAKPFILNDLQDPDLFIDDDGKAYMFWGSSNTFPIRGKELDPNNNFKPISKTTELFKLDGDKHGWERFGENHSDTKLKGYMEGAWLTKHNGKYYMQYAAPGTEFNVYGDGVYVADKPLGPYTYAQNNPISYKPGGFINGAGQGSTVVGPGGQYWHYASMALSVNVNWERRLCAYPTFFDADGLMYSDTYFGDYPHFAPALTEKHGKFTGWMLLNYNKPITASSTLLPEHSADKAVDENVKTFWLAAKNDDKQWLQVDLQKPATVYAVQLNFADYKSNLYGRVPGLKHQYAIEGSTDGKNWKVLIYKKDSFTDNPNDYVELETPVKARYIRYNNVHVPANLAVCGFRVFGKSDGAVPQTPGNFQVDRKTDRRDAMISWNKVKGAQGYNVKWGIAPNKLYSSWLIYDKNELDLKSLGTDQAYYFSIESFNENGVSKSSTPKKVR